MTDHAQTPTVRLSTLDDLASICEIYNHEVLNSSCTFDTEPLEGRRAEAWFRSHTKPQYPLTVCVCSGIVVGWASLSAWSGRCAYDKAAETSVYIQQKHRGRGYSTVLYEDLIARARALGYRVLIARLALPNPASERLHERVGFTDIGLMRNIGEKFGELIDVRLMDMQLDER